MKPQLPGKLIYLNIEHNSGVSGVKTIDLSALPLGHRDPQQCNFVAMKLSWFDFYSQLHFTAYILYVQKFLRKFNYFAKISQNCSSALAYARQQTC